MLGCAGQQQAQRHASTSICSIAPDNSSPQLRSHMCALPPGGVPPAIVEAVASAMWIWQEGLHAASHSI